MADQSTAASRIAHLATGQDGGPKDAQEVLDAIKKLLESFDGPALKEIPSRNVGGGNGDTQAQAGNGQYQPQEGGAKPDAVAIKRCETVLSKMATAEVFGNRAGGVKSSVGAKKPKNILHPMGTKRGVYDTVCLLLASLYLCYMPYGITFCGYSLSNQIFYFCTDLFFIADIAVNCRTAVVDDDAVIQARANARCESPGWELFILSCPSPSARTSIAAQFSPGPCQPHRCVLAHEQEPRAIFREYAHGWLAVDLLGSLPFDWLAVGPLFSESGNQGLVDACKVVRLLTLLRFCRYRYLLKWEERMASLSSNAIRFLHLLGVMLLFSHWNGCIQYLVSYLEHFPSDSCAACNACNARNARSTRSARNLSHLEL